MGVVVGNSGLYDESKWKSKTAHKTNNYIKNNLYKHPSINRGEEQKWQA